MLQQNTDKRSRFSAAIRQPKLASGIMFLLSAALLATSAAAAVIEEITVHAQKREQSILDVPLSVSVYSGETMSQVKIRDVGDLVQLSPSLTIEDGNGSVETALSIRGIGTAGNNPSFEQSVGIFIDGVYRGRAGSAVADYVDVESIEVLKGPQGTLFGRNTAAGVLNIRTNKPSYESGGRLEASLGNYGMRQIRASITGAMIEDKLAFSLAGAWHERDGFAHNIINDQEPFDRDRWNVRGQLLWDINADASLRLIADRSEIQEVCCPGTVLIKGDNQAVLNLLFPAETQYPLPSRPTTIPGLNNPERVDIGKRLINTPNLAADETEDEGISAELNWDIDVTTLTVIGSYRNFENFQSADADYLPTSLLKYRHQTYDQDEATLEIRLASDGTQTLDWTVGAYLYYSDLAYDSPLPIGEDLRTLLDAGAPGLLAAFELGQLALGADGITPDRIGNFYYGPDNTSSAGADSETESFAFFGQVTWHATEDLSIDLGLRYSNEQKNADYIPDFNNPFSELDANELLRGALASPIPGVGLALDPAAGAAANNAALDAFLATSTGAAVAAALQAGLIPGLQAAQFLVPFEPFSADYDDDNISGTASINYNVNDDVNVYARYTRGYKGGGLNLDRAAAAATPGINLGNPDTVQFDPETVDAFELGMKSRLLNDSLSVNAALYYQTLEDFQYQFFDGTALLIRNAAEVESKGLELDVTYVPSYRWLFSAGIAVQDASYSKFPNGAANTQARLAGLANGQVDMSGQPVVHAPDFSSAFLVGFNQPIGDALEITANVNVVYRSDAFTDVSNDPSGKNDTKQLNLTLGIGSPTGAWALELWGKNLTDEGNFAGGISQALAGPGFTLLRAVEPPRTYGLTAKVNF
jgi:outer membrane receptor protein involved in Fe transport